jgi:hypothetical protein
VDALQADLASIAERAAADGEGTGTTYLRIRHAVIEAVNGRSHHERTGDTDNGADDVAALVGARSGTERPRLTEPWFCCAEPTAGQFGSLGQLSD